MKIKLNEIAVEVVQKEIKNVHLSVYPPDGKVKVSAPATMALDTICVFVISKLAWIKKQRTKLRAQERETSRECVDRESHYFNGKRYLLKVVEKNTVSRVYIDHSKIILKVRPKTTQAKKQAVLTAWYRQQLKTELVPLIAHWQQKINVSVKLCTVRKMKTLWGSCTPASHSIRINLELAKKPPECLEYIVVHELVYLLEPSHNKRFVTLMDQFLPK